MRLFKILATLVLCLFAGAQLCAQDFTETFEEGNLNNWILGPNAKYSITTTAHSGAYGAVDNPGPDGIVTFTRRNFSACTGTFTVWFLLEGPTVDSRIRILVSPDNATYYGAWFNPNGTDNPLFRIDRCVNGVTTNLITGPIPPPRVGQWYKFTFSRAADGTLVASINDSNAISAKDNMITQPGTMQIPAYQDFNNFFNGNYMYFDDVSAVNTSASCATGIPKISSITPFAVTGLTCSASAYDLNYSVCDSGTSTLNVDSVYFIGASGASFSIVGRKSFSVAPGDCATITIHVTPPPVATTAVSGVMRMITNAANVAGGIDDIPVSIQLDTLAFISSADTINFGNVSCSAIKQDTSFFVRSNSSITANLYTQSVKPPFAVWGDSVGVPAIAPNTTRQILLRFTPPASGGVYKQKIALVDSCGTVDSITLIATVSAPSLQVSGAIDFGDVLCDSIRTIDAMIKNTGVTATIIQTPTTHAPFVIAPLATLQLNAGDSMPIAIQFIPTQAGTFSDSIVIATNGCGNKSLTISITGKKERNGIALGRVPSDTLDYGVFCPTDNFTDTSFDLINLASFTNAFHLSVHAPFSFLGDPTTNPLDTNYTRSIGVRFTPGADGTYFDSVVVHDSCDNRKVVYLLARVESPNITVASEFDTVECNVKSITARIPLTNAGTVARLLTITSADSILPNLIGLGPGMSDTITVTIPVNAALDTTQGVVTILDDCGGTRAVTLNVIKRKVNVTMHLNIDTNTIRDGGVAAVNLFALPQKYLLPFDTMHVYLTNEITELGFKSVSSQCTSITDSMIAPNVELITITGCGSPANPVATVYYNALIGTTLSPTVSLDSLIGISPCASITGADIITVPLRPHGCELNTLAVRSFTTAIQSVYPNPSTTGTTLTYSLLEQVPVQFAVTNSLGQTLRTITIDAATPGTYTTHISTDDLETGMYVVTLRAGAFKDAAIIGVVR